MKNASQPAPIAHPDYAQPAPIAHPGHTQEEAGQVIIGWNRQIYPTRDTALAAIAQQDMYVMEVDGIIRASGRINQEQVPEYVFAHWEQDAPPHQVMVLHTMTIDPEYARRGAAKAFVNFYETYALDHGCPYLRIDTNERNTRARKLYSNLGYKEIDIVPCTFNGIEGVQLVCIEKTLAEKL